MATIYREGSTDREMNKRIQKVVGVSADGVWGPKTTAAVKAWQKAHLLQADGLVGPATLAAMGLSEDAGRQTATTEGITITKAPINQHITRCQNRPIRYIAIHYTAGSTSGEGAAMRNRNVFLKRAASADFCVDDKTIIQVNPDLKNYYCWSVGDKKNPWTGGGRLNGKAVNKNTISIEICSNLKQGASASAANHEGWYFTYKSLENARKLVKYLMKTYSIPKENIIRHYDVTGKLCPGVPGWNDGPLYTTNGVQTKEKNNSMEWERFWKSI